MSSFTPAYFQVGQTIQEYRLRRNLSTSSTAAVWEAENADGEARALKFLQLPENPDDPSVRHEIRAIQMVAALEHPHLTHIEKIWTLPKHFAIAMPLADGTLQDLFDAYQEERGTGIEPAELCEYLRQAASALDFLNLQKHRCGSWLGGIQHCGIKPQNLLLFGERVKLIDYNLASPTARYLPHGTRLGTAAYIAPEIWAGRLSDATDQYSLAITYCYLRSGQLPLSVNPPKPGQSLPPRHVPDLSTLTPAERPVVAKALSLSSRDRWKSSTEFIAQLAGVMAAPQVARR